VLAALNFSSILFCLILNSFKELHYLHIKLKAIKISALISNWLKMKFIFKKPQKGELIAERKKC